MARLLGAEVAMVNSLGDDVFGDMTVRNFEALGIDTTYLARVPGSSGVAPIWVEPDGTNRIICVAGANDAMVPADAAAAIRALAPLDAVVGQFEIPQAVTAAAFAAARAIGAVTDPQPGSGRRHGPGPPGGRRLGHPERARVRPPRRCIERRHGCRDRRVRRAGRGPGSSSRSGHAGPPSSGATASSQRVPAPAVKATDTTGAGDAFVGAFAYGLADGLDELDAVRLGVRCASDSVQRPGTQSSFPRDAGR